MVRTIIEAVELLKCAEDDSGAERARLEDDSWDITLDSTGTGKLVEIRRCSSIQGRH
jgi:hypothetical protein